MINSARFFAVLGIIFLTETQSPLSTRADENAQPNLASGYLETPNKVPLDKKADSSEQQNWLFHFQGTEILQGQPGFHAPYSGINSLHPGDNFRITHGIAAFPNAQSSKVGKYRGDVFIPHLFLRQVWGFGGEQEQMEGSQLQLAEKQDISRFTLTVGRMSVTDQFDNNAYAHDPSSQFLNWAVVDQGSFDFAGDSLGYEQGLTLELYQKRWAARWGIFTVPRVSNGFATDGHYLKAWQQVAELEERYELFGHPGKVRFLGYLENANMGSFAATVHNPSLQEDIARTRRYR